jgi:two-component system, OmpR family, response regulator RegX3
MTRILVVEDEETIADSIAYTLRSEGFDVETVADGNIALERALEDAFELMLLDVMLPGLSGFEVCRRVRSQSALPILMLTARTAEVDRVMGLEAGADDYILKPFSMPELVGRVRAMLRRRELDRGESTPGVLRVGGLELDVGRRTATVDGRTITLTNSEFHLLAALAERPGHVVSRRELMQRLWDSTYVGDARAADVHVANLRRKIERDPTNPVRLVTVRGAGYALAEV